MLSRKTFGHSPTSNLFLFDPESAALPNRMQLFLRCNRNHIITALLLVLAATACLYVLAWGLVEQQALNDIQRRSTFVEGVILSRRATAPGPLNLRVSYFVTYFFIEGQRVFTREQIVPANNYETLFEGQRVTVRHLIGDPESSALAAPHADDTLTQTSFIAVVLGIAGALVALIYTCPVLHRLWQNARLIFRGRILTGCVLASQRCYEGGEQPRRTAYIDLRCRFRTPEGNVLTAHTIRACPDLAKARLPGFGTPVAILYLNKDNYSIL